MIATDNLVNSSTYDGGNYLISSAEAPYKIYLVSITYYTGNFSDNLDLVEVGALIPKKSLDY